MRKSCLLSFLGLAALCADIISIFEGIESVLSMIFQGNFDQLLPLNKSPVLFAIILFYGLIGIGAAVWYVLINRKIIGPVQVIFYSFFLHTLISLIPICSYGNAVDPSNLGDFLFSWETIIMM